jgi:hypothetical protein
MMKSARWDRIDICEAWYVFAMEWHGGQFSKEYEIFGRLENISFSPSLLLNNCDDLEDNARTIYDELVAEVQI